jgi:hypothetical protein
MTQIQNIHQDLTTIMSRAIQLWSNLLCGDDTVIGFTYNNEPKQTKTGI